MADFPSATPSTPTTDKTTEGKIPKKESNEFVDSSLQETSSQIISNKKIKANKGIDTTGGSLGIGTLKLGQNASALILRDRQNREFSVPQNLVSPLGSSPTFVPRVGIEGIPTIRQGSDVQNTTISSVFWFAIVEDDTQLNQIIFRALSDTPGVRLVVRENDALGDILSITEEDETWELGEGFSLTNGGDSTIPLVSSIGFFDGQVLHFKLEVFSGTFTIRGDTVPFGGQPSAFVPYIATLDQLFDLNLLADGGGLIRRLTGSVAITPGTAAVVGTGTLFLTELAIGESVQIREENFTVLSITNDLNFTLSDNHVIGAGAGIGGGLNAVVFAEENVLDVKNFSGKSRLKLNRLGALQHEGDRFETTVNDVIHLPSLVGTNAQTFARVNIYRNTNTASTITNKNITAGNIASPAIEIDDLSVFSANDIVFLDTPRNKGLYEVGVQIGAVVFLRGVGGASNVEDWTLDQVTTATETGSLTKVNVSVSRTSLLGEFEHGKGTETPITFFQLAHADDVPIVKVEEFAATEATFNSELGLPSAQGFTDTELVNGTITLITDTVFGVQKNVIKYDVPASGDTVKSEIPVTATNWGFNLTHGFSFRGEGCRLTEDIDTQSIFSGTGFSAANDPRPTSIQSRVGIFISEDGTNTTIRLDGQSAVALDGTSGKPLVPKDTYFDWEVFVDETPDAGVTFGAATLTVNGIQIVVGGIISSNNAVSDEVSVANSSSTGSTTFYFVGFGVTMYEEGAVKTLSVGTMASDIMQVIRPKGNRDHRVILPDGNPRKAGNRFDNLGGSAGTKLTLQTENTSLPQSLFNSLNELEINVTSSETISFVNIVEGGNVYLGEVNILNQDPLGFSPGSFNYDPVKGTMNVRNIFPGSSVQVGQESVVFVMNNSGATIVDGKVINISGYDATTDALEIELAIADTVENTEVLGVTTTTMIDGAVGLVTVFGRVNDLDTTGFTAGEVVYLSATVAGELTSTKPAIPIQMGHIGKIDALVGFLQVEIKEMEKSIFGGFSHSADQPFTAGVSKPIAFNTNEEVSGISHSQTVDNSEFTFTSGGVYQTTAEPQYTRTSGGGTDVLNVFIQKDTGSGFGNVPRTNVKFGVNTASVQNVSPLTSTFRVDAGDKIQFMAQVESSNLQLDSFPASGTAPNEIPATPSVIMNIVRIGD